MQSSQPAERLLNRGTKRRHRLIRLNTQTIKYRQAKSPLKVAAYRSWQLWRHLQLFVHRPRVRGQVPHE